ncbi:hypothetical protein PIROE2DRAFT_2531, partial [Piromyces sp. E2]
DLEEETTLLISNSTFDNFVTNTGFETKEYSYVNLTNCTIKYSTFKEGFIPLNINMFGKFEIDETTFFNNTGVNGIIVNVDDYYQKSKIFVNFTNSIFENNYAEGHGGIIYSKGEDIYDYIKFYNCSFENNKAVLGDISYSLTKKDEPYFSNIDELRKFKRSFITNPTHIKIISNLNNSLSVMSGEKLSSDIKCKLYDDYENGISSIIN